MTTVARVFGVRELALEALEKYEREVGEREAELTVQQRHDLEQKLHERVLRLFGIASADLTEAEEVAFFRARWFSLTLLDPGMVDHARDTDFAAVKGFAPVYIIDGVMFAASRHSGGELLVAEWSDSASPTNLEGIAGTVGLGRWVQARQAEESERDADV